jgi:hypothetical protein
MLDPAVLSHLIPLFTQHVSQDSYHQLGKSVGLCFSLQHHVDADPNADPDSTYHPDTDPDADPDAEFYLMRIRIRLFTF